MPKEELKGATHSYWEPPYLRELKKELGGWDTEKESVRLTELRWDYEETHKGEV